MHSHYHSPVLTLIGDLDLAQVRSAFNKVQVSTLWLCLEAFHCILRKLCLRLVVWYIFGSPSPFSGCVPSHSCGVLVSHCIDSVLLGQLYWSAVPVCVSLCLHLSVIRKWHNVCCRSNHHTTVWQMSISSICKIQSNETGISMSDPIALHGTVQL